MKSATPKTPAAAIVCVLIGTLVCGCTIRPYDPLTDVPKPLFGDGIIPLERDVPKQQVDDPRDDTIEALERRMGIAKP